MEQKPIHELNCMCNECVSKEQVGKALMDARNRLTASEVLRPRYAPFYALLEEVKALHDSKGSDYEGQGKPYCNLRGPEEWGVPAWVYAMTRCEEKMKRLKTFAKGSTLKHEGARDSLMDIAVLSLIAIVLMEETKANK